ncbi:hypothetical protein ACYATO_08740 [Lactobacillaceae bacterium Melli_B3]
MKKLIQATQEYPGSNILHPQYFVDLKQLKSNHEPVSYWVDYQDGNTVYSFSAFDLLDLNRAADEIKAQKAMLKVYQNHQSEFKNWLPKSNGFAFMQVFQNQHKRIENHRFAKQLLNFRRYMMRELSHQN